MSQLGPSTPNDTESLRGFVANACGDITRAVSQIVEVAQRETNPTLIAHMLAQLNAGLLAVLKPSDLCQLVVSKALLGQQVDFVIPVGISGSQIVKAIEKTHPRTGKDGLFSADFPLQEDTGFTIVDLKAPRRCSFVICEGTANMKPIPQAQYLASFGLSLSENWVVALGAALYRDRMGYPEHRDDIGSADDTGDLFASRSVRTQSAILETLASGICSKWKVLADKNGPQLVAAGSPQPYGTAA